MRLILYSLFLSIVIPVLSWATYSLPSDRSIIWTGNVGVTGDIPAETQTVYVTLSPNGVSDTKNIQNALTACPVGQVVKLNAGVFRNTTSAIWLSGGKVLRGSGQGVTTILGTTSQVSTTMINTIGANLDSNANARTITAGNTKGSTVVTAAAHGFNVNDVVLIDQLDDINADPPVTVNGSYTSDCTWCGRAGLTRSQSQLVRVVAKDTDTFTTNVPLYTSFTRTPQAIKYVSVPSGSGLENLTIDGTLRSSDAGMIYYQAIRDSWIKNIEVKGIYSNGIILRGAHKITVRGCSFHESATSIPAQDLYKSNVQGIQVTYYASANLIENNEFYNIGSAIVLAGASGNVIGYNNIHDTFNYSVQFNPQTIFFHGAHNYMNLVEGNYAIGRLTSDFYWGTSSHNTFFRNKFQFKSGLTDGGWWDVDLHTYSWYYSFIGNVLGTTSLETEYEQNAVDLTGKKAIYRTGYTADGDGTAAGNDSVVNTSLLRHGNWDSVNNSTVWNGSDDKALPSSFYLTVQPSWLASYPAYGPEAIKSIRKRYTNFMFNFFGF